MLRPTIRRVADRQRRAIDVHLADERRAANLLNARVYILERQRQARIPGELPLRTVRIQVEDV